MSTPATQHIPQWDLADRMRKSLRQAHIGVADMADYLGVGRNTVSTWINGRIVPGTQTLRLWAIRCDVSYTWLATGDPADELGRKSVLTSHDARSEFRCGLSQAEFNHPCTRAA
jgi:transcriptional regulator with XRE-family HTH domain